MVDFWVYDVIFMVLFTALVTLFLVRHRKDTSREGLMFMYRSKFGVKAINYIGDNFRKFLYKMRYVIIPLGFVLMTTMFWMLIQTMLTYILNPRITDIIKAPPIAPLIPYFPKLFGMESFFPPFYFTYFILALAVVAIVHEFSHGIFMRAFKVKIKSTGMVFLGPILGAFVEEDKNQFVKKKKSEQMTILGAGVFANILFALIFYGLYVLFFFTSFAPSGYLFDSYGISAINSSAIESQSIGPNNMTMLDVNGSAYYLDENLAYQLETDSDFIFAYVDSPAVKAQIRGAIIQANDVEIMNQESLRLFMQNTVPGEMVTFLTENEAGEIVEYEIELAEHPVNPEIGYLGVGNSINQPRGFVRKFLSNFMSFKENSTYYKPTWDGEFVYFVYHLLWWVMIINLLVALFNMLPLGILDGGRFFYLGALALVKKEKAAQLISKIAGKIILLTFIVMMFYWLVGIVS
jgi:membrane-associated protease RseP (regulator of RpoE activity)